MHKFRQPKAVFYLATYRYPTESLVDSVQVLTNEKGGLRAYLYADNGADSEKLRLVKQALREQNLKCVPTLQGERPVLEVRGFKKAEELMGYLNGLHVLTGTPEIITEPGDKRTEKEKLANATLKMAGFTYNVGDAAILYYTLGLLRKTWKEESAKPKGSLFGLSEGKFFGIVDVIAGVGYGLGSLCLTFFGSKDQSINTITTATSKIERFAHKEGYNIPTESSLAYANQEPKRDLWHKITHFVERYPSESLNAIFVGVGACLSAGAFFRATRPLEKVAYSAEKATEWGAKTIEEFEAKAAKEFAKDKNGQIWDRIDVGLGAVTATSAIIGLAVKEHKRVEGDPKPHGLAAIRDWICEKPLRATGIGYMIATCFHAVATAGKWRNGTEPKKYLIGRVLFIITNFMAEGLIALSSKGHGIGVKPDSSVDDSIISAASELVLRQPEEKRAAVISQLSGYMASPEVMDVKAEKIEQGIRQLIAMLSQNPWTKHYVSNQKGEMVEVETGQVVSTPEQPKPQEKPINTVAANDSQHQDRLVSQEHALA